MRKTVFFLLFSFCIVLCVIASEVEREEIPATGKKLRFFNLDLHVSVIADVKNILSHFGHEVVDWSISGHTWVFGRQRDVVEIVNENTWGGLNQQMCDQFYERYFEFLNQFDGFIVTHNSTFALLYERFDKPIIIINSTRYENPYTRSPEDWARLNEYLRKGVANEKIFIFSNNKADSYYLKYYTGIDSEVVPSLCLYTNETYHGNKRNFFCHALAGASTEFDQMLERTARQVGLFAGLPWGYPWRDLYQLRGVVHFPYNISTMSLFEQYSANMPLFFPTKSFLLKLHSLFPRSILPHLSFLRDPDFANLRMLEDEPNNVKNPSVVQKWIDLADYYDTENMPFIQYFDSIEELRFLLRTTDCQLISQKMREHNIKRKHNVLQKWKSLLDKIEKICNKDQS